MKIGLMLGHRQAKPVHMQTADMHEAEYQLPT